MDISVKHGEVRTYAGNLNQWAQQLKAIRQSISARSHSLESQWRDPQYRVFLDIAKTQGNNLGSAIEQFEKTARELTRMANDLERMQQEIQQRLGNLRR